MSTIPPNLLSHRLQETSLRYFVEVVQTGSITDAAKKLHVTPSAVSRQIATLEEMFGVPLFDRHPRGMVASPAGELLAGFVRRGALEADRVVSDILALQGLRKGHVRLASAAGFALEFLPKIIAEFRELHPGIRFSLQTGTGVAVSAAVIRGDADLGLCYTRAAESGIRVSYRQAAPVIVTMRPDHALSRFKTVRLAQLHPYPIALPDKENTVRQLFDIACSHQRLVFEPVLVSNHHETLTNFVAHNGGISIAGELTVRLRVARGELATAVIRERGMDSRTIELQSLSDRTLPKSVSTFHDFLVSRLPNDIN